MSVATAVLNNEEDSRHLIILNNDGNLLLGPICGRCGVKLGRITNRGAQCPLCRQKVCKSCREYTPRPSDWICSVCHTNLEIPPRDWMDEISNLSEGFHVTNNSNLSSTDRIIRQNSVKRSWTISNPELRWLFRRTSAEFRPFSSLPRGQNVETYQYLKTRQIKNKNNSSATTKEEKYIADIDIEIEESVKQGEENEENEKEQLKRHDFLPENKESIDLSQLIEITKKFIENEKCQRSNYGENEVSLKVESVKSINTFGEIVKTILEQKYLDSEQENSETETINKSLSKDRFVKRSSVGRSHVLVFDCSSGASNDDNNVSTEDGECDTLSFEKKASCKRRKQGPSAVRVRKSATRDNKEDQNPEDSTRILVPDVEDYKLVFISSDSSSKEEEIEDNDSSSTSTIPSISLDDCDWDYFEPSCVTTTSVRPIVRDWSSNRNSPFGSPQVYRRSALNSPLSCRKNRIESDTGTDEDISRTEIGSSTSSDGFNYNTHEKTVFTESVPSEMYQKNVFGETIPNYSSVTTAETSMQQFVNKENQVCTDQCSQSERSTCYNCGAASSQPQFIPIPIPVPIPVPVPTLWNPLESVIVYNPDFIDSALRMRLRAIQQKSDIWLWPFINQAAFISSTTSSGSWLTRTIDATTFNEQMHLNVKILSESCNLNEKLNSVINSENNTHNTVVNDNNDNCSDSKDDVDKNVTPDNNIISEIKNNENIENKDVCCVEENDRDNYFNISPGRQSKNCGYLESESKYLSSDESRDSSDSGNNCEKGDKVRRLRVRRKYNLVGGSRSNNDDDTSSDSGDEYHCISPGSKSMTSSSSDTDSDDSNCQKSKLFKRVYVVNSKSPVKCSSNSEDETSDNNTDTEKNYDESDDKSYTNILKHDSVVLEIDSDDKNLNDNSDEPVVLLKYIKSSYYENCNNEVCSENSSVACKNEINSDTDIKSMNDNEYKYESHSMRKRNKKQKNINNIQNSDSENNEDINSEIKTHQNENNSSAEKSNDKKDIKSDMNINKNKPQNSKYELNTITHKIKDKKKKNSSTISDTKSKDNKHEIKVLAECDLSQICTTESETNNDQDNSTEPDTSCAGGNNEWAAVEGEETGGGHNSGDVTTVNLSVDSERSGGRHAANRTPHTAASAARYTSLVMITQQTPASQVNVVTSKTTTLMPTSLDVVVRHTNCESNNSDLEDSSDDIAPNTLTGYFTLTDLMRSPTFSNNDSDEVTILSSSVMNSDAKKKEDSDTLSGYFTLTDLMRAPKTDSDEVTVLSNDPGSVMNNEVKKKEDNVTVVTGGDTLSAVVCLEEGLADDDSWVEELSHDEDEFATTTPTEDSSSGEEANLNGDREEELRGYHRSAIDFTLHTIVEESCEESENEPQIEIRKQRSKSTTELEKYFCFELGEGPTLNKPDVRKDSDSETSSVYSESMDSLGGPDEDGNQNGDNDTNELVSSRLEKYFLSGFMGFTPEKRDSDESGSVGSDSEGRPSPEHRRKRLVRARGTGRSYSSSLDNIHNADELMNADQDKEGQLDSEGSSTETDTYEDSSNFDKSDGQFETVKRKKSKKSRGLISGGNNSPIDEKKLDVQIEDENEDELSKDDDGNKTPQPDFLLPLNTDFSNSKKQQSRDSGFVGSFDDLSKEQKNIETIKDSLFLTKVTEVKEITENSLDDSKIVQEKSEKISSSIPPVTSLTRKDSFNNWSSDEETNLMMSKMRQFFKTMVSNSQKQRGFNMCSKSTIPIIDPSNSPKASPQLKQRSKPPQLIYFENELTRLMKTVPGIRDDQVKEIVEYLSSEDTWSDSYDSSDYTSSDIEGAASFDKSVLQQQISDSCQQIISKFEMNAEDEEGDEGDGGIIDEAAHSLNRETAFVYQKLVASFSKIATGDSTNDPTKSAHNSPPLIAKVMHHIGSRLVALMHEVSSGESHSSSSPKGRLYHKRLQQKISSGSTTTTEDDDSTSDTNLQERLDSLKDSVSAYNILPRSRSHDLLLSEVRALHQSSSGVSDIVEERETSDCERFSWRGSFESALMATDSRTRLSVLSGGENSSCSSVLALAAKRRSAGDLLFNHKSLSREQLDRVRSCGSIGGGNSEIEKCWIAPVIKPPRRRSSVPDTMCESGESADGEEDEEDLDCRSTLPRSLQTGTVSTNSLPRLPTTSTKTQNIHHFLQNNAKSARYRPPGYNRPMSAGGPKRAVSAPGLQPVPRKESRKRIQQLSVSTPDDDSIISEAGSSPLTRPKNSSGSSKSINASPASSGKSLKKTHTSSTEWSAIDEEDKVETLHHTTSLSSFGMRSDSMASVYSGAGEGRYGTVTVRGQVEFGLQYNYKDGALEISVKQCRDLAPVDTKRNRSDPYVKVYLLPDKSKSGKRKTKVKKHTLNPVFDETLRFHMSLSSLETRTLWLTVWHSDMFGRNDFLGEVMMALENKVFDDPTPLWYNLQERTEPFEDLMSYKGDIIVGLKFIPPDVGIVKKGKRSKGALHVLIKEAKNLTAVKANGTSDPFCKSYLLPDKGRSSKQKTPVLRKTVNPVWNYTFVYDDVSLQELSERSLELTVWDHDRLASNEFLGGVRFSLGTGKHYGKPVEWLDSTGKELSLWQNMLERPNFWVEGSVSLRPSLENRVN